MTQKPITVNEDLIRQVAHLARLDLNDEEACAFTAQVGSILNYVEQLQTVDVSGVAPMTHPLELETPMRDDEVRPSPKDAQGRPRVLTSAPESLDEGYKVPPIL